MELSVLEEPKEEEQVYWQAKNPKPREPLKGSAWEAVEERPEELKPCSDQQMKNWVAFYREVRPKGLEKVQVLLQEWNPPPGQKEFLNLGEAHLEAVFPV